MSATHQRLHSQLSNPFLPNLDSSIIEFPSPRLPSAVSRYGVSPRSYARDSLTIPKLPSYSASKSMALRSGGVLSWRQGSYVDLASSIEYYKAQLDIKRITETTKSFFDCLEECFERKFTLNGRARRPRSKSFAGFSFSGLTTSSSTPSNLTSLEPSPSLPFKSGTLDVLAAKPCLLSAQSSSISETGLVLRFFSQDDNCKQNIQDKNANKLNPITNKNHTYLFDAYQALCEHEAKYGYNPDFLFSPDLPKQIEYLTGNDINPREAYGADAFFGLMDVEVSNVNAFLKSRESDLFTFCIKRCRSNEEEKEKTASNLITIECSKTIISLTGICQKEWDAQKKDLKKAIPSWDLYVKKEVTDQTLQEIQSYYFRFFTTILNEHGFMRFDCVKDVIQHGNLSALFKINLNPFPKKKRKEKIFAITNMMFSYLLKKIITRIHFTIVGNSIANLLNIIRESLEDGYITILPKLQKDNRSKSKEAKEREIHFTEILDILPKLPMHQIHFLTNEVLRQDLRVLYLYLQEDLLQAKIYDANNFLQSTLPSYNIIRTRIIAEQRSIVSRNKLSTKLEIHRKQRLSKSAIQMKERGSRIEKFKTLEELAKTCEAEEKENKEKKEAIRPLITRRASTNLISSDHPLKKEGSSQSETDLAKCVLKIQALQSIPLKCPPPDEFKPRSFRSRSRPASLVAPLQPNMLSEEACLKEDEVSRITAQLCMQDVMAKIKTADERYVLLKSIINNPEHIYILHGEKYIDAKAHFESISDFIDIAVRKLSHLAEKNWESIVVHELDKSIQKEVLSYLKNNNYKSFFDLYLKKQILSVDPMMNALAEHIINMADRILNILTTTELAEKKMDRILSERYSGRVRYFLTDPIVWVGGTFTLNQIASSLQLSNK